jgi:hypothetical protein
MKILVMNATNDQIDYLVARGPGTDLSDGLTDDERYSTDPSRMWPLIEQHRISTVIDQGDDYWQAVVNACSGSMFGPGIAGDCYSEGPTSLVAAARCYIRSLYGKEVEVPDELL